jgi:hypothetical protein
MTCIDEQAEGIEPTTWEIEITRDGMWPFVWEWQTWKRWGYKQDLRVGSAMTKERARKKALAAKRSMENDDVRVTYS